MKRALWREVQTALLALPHKPTDNGAIRGEWVHIDDIRKFIEQRNFNKWSAESITREVRRMRSAGILTTKASGLYKLGNIP